MRRGRRHPRVSGAIGACALMVGLAACADDEGPSELVIVDEWTLPAGTGEDAVVNLVIVSPRDDAIVSASVPSSVAADAVLEDADGATLDAIVVPNDVAVFFRPDNDHVVLEDLARDLEDGDRFELTLELEEAGERFVAVTVGDGPPFD